MNDKHGGSLLEFFVGLLLLGAGLFMITNQVTVTSSFGMLRWGGFSIPFGLTTVPLIIGIIWLFVKPESMLPKIVIVLGRPVHYCRHYHERAVVFCQNESVCVHSDVWYDSRGNRIDPEDSICIQRQVPEGR